MRKPTGRQVPPELLNSCLQLLEQGETVPACLARYPAHAADLEPLLENVLMLRRVGAAPVPRNPVAATAGRTAFMQAVDVLVAEQYEPGLTERLARGWQRFLSGFVILRPLPTGLLASLIAVVALGLLTTGVVLASADALPGQPLYVVRYATDEARLWLAAGPEMRAAVQAEVDGRRRNDARAVAGQGAVVNSMLIAGVIEGFSPEEWRISGLSVLIRPETAVVGTPAIGAAVRGSVRAPGDGTLIALSLHVEAPAALPSSSRPLPVLVVAEPSLSASATRSSSPTPTPEPTYTATLEPTVIPSAMANLPSERVDDRLFWSPIATLTTQSSVTPTPTARPTVARRATPSPTMLSTPRPVVRYRLYDFVHVIDGNRWTVGNTTVFTDSNTEYINDPRVGRHAWVVAVERDGVLIAESITGEKVPPTPELREWTALVSTIDGETWHIGYYSVRVTEATKISGSPVAGSMVTCVAEMREGVAWAISITALTLQDLHYNGVVTSINGDMWRLDSGVEFRVDGDTRVGSGAGVGILVETTLYRLPDGTLWAAYVGLASPTSTPVPTNTRRPTITPTVTRTASPTARPSVTPTATPTRLPSMTPTVTPTAVPSVTPTSTAMALTPTSTPPAPATSTATPTPPAPATQASPTATPSSAPAMRAPGDSQ